jgi:hypothetical protein
MTKGISIGPLLSRLWDGSAKAVHDYLSRNSIPARIFQSKEGVCYIVKPKN